MSPTPQSLLALFFAASLAGCPTLEPEPEPTTPAPFDPSAYDLISADLTEPVGEMDLGDGAENVFSVMRYWTDTHVRIVAVEAMFKVRDEYDAPAHLAIWPDWGHNFFDFKRDEPLVEWDLDLDRYEADEQWTLIELDEPIELDHPGLVYVGTHWKGDDAQPRLMVDDVISADPFLADKMAEPYPQHVAVYPDRGRDANGFETVRFAGTTGLPGVGDLMVRLYVERVDVVEDGAFWFSEQQSLGEETRSGLPGSGSVAWGDCNDDGLLDVYDGNLRVNNGDGTFTAESAAAGIDVGGGSGMWGDYDNDGDLDLFVARKDDQLYEAQGDCNFVNVTAASGIDDTQTWNTGDGPIEQTVDTPSAAWVDVNGDGRLDLYQANFLNFGTGDASIDKLWLNQGDGLFVDGTDDWGLVQSGGSAGRGVHPADWDNDGDMDIFVSNYRLHQDFAWRNEGDSFTATHNTALGGTPNGLWPNTAYGHTIGSVWGDLDNDGDLDLFAASLAHPRFITFSDKSKLLRNEVATGEWTAMRDEAGMLYMETDSSPVFLDYDNDGDLDLFYTAIYEARPSYLYRNDGDWSFKMVSYPAGTWMWNGWGVAAADWDNDGDVDLYGKKALRNETGATGNWLSVEAVGSGDAATNTSGIGARVYVTTDASTQMREVSSGVGVGCQNPLRQHVGIGDAETADVRVLFPLTGTEVTLDGVEAGRRLVVHEDGTVE
jgi:hypothetical protein